MMRKMTFAAVVAGALITTPAAGAPHHVHASHSAAVPAQALSPIEKLIATARTNYLRREKDQYADDLKSDIVEGTPFSLNFKADDVKHTDSQVWYHDGRIEFSLSPQQTPRDIFHMDRADYQLLKVGATSKGTQWVGSNAFGASRVVDSYKDRSSALALISVPDGGTYNRFKYVMEGVSGSAAKAIVTNARVLIEGTVSALPDDKIAECRMWYIEATIDMPTEIKDLICFAGVRVTRLAFVNGATGETIHEWLKSEDEAAAPTTPASPRPASRE